MILVNISAVGTSTTLILHPVSCSHFGPEKLSGSSDCRPASHTMVTVLPAQIFLAASTALCAALCALARPEKAKAAMASNAREAARANEPGRRTMDACVPMILLLQMTSFLVIATCNANCARLPGQPADYVEHAEAVSS